MKKVLFIFAVICPLIAANAQVIMRIGDQDITKQEFEYYYHKNSSAQLTDTLSVADYANLFINFKLKVMEAYQLRMDTIPEFRNELAGYRKQLSTPYLTDKKALDKYTQEAYKHLQEDVKVSHILIDIKNGEDTLLAYNKALEVRKRLAKEDFESVAREVSQDPSVSNNGGMLGYITGMQMIYPFEAAAYNTAVGTISKPIRTRFGYHIIKVWDRRPSKGQFQLSHIFMRRMPNTTETQADSIRQRMDSLYQRALQGDDFAELARNYSEDNNAEQGGLMSWISTGQTTPWFEDAAFQLETPGEIAPVVEAPYGWHIIRLEGRKPNPSFDEMKPRIERRIASDERSILIAEHFVNSLKKEYKYKKGKKDIIATFANVVLTRSDAEAWFAANPGVGPDSMEVFINSQLMAYENNHLEEKHPEFRALMQEYNDGILLFNISNDMVWNKAIQDTLGLSKYFEDHLQNYAQTQSDGTISYPASYTEVKGAVTSDYQNALEAAWLEQLRKKYPVQIYEEQLKNIR